MGRVRIPLELFRQMVKLRVDIDERYFDDTKAHSNSGERRLATMLERVVAVLREY